MKKIIFTCTVLFVIIFSTNKSVGKGCWLDVWIKNHLDSELVEPGGIIDATFNIGDTINMNVRMNAICFYPGYCGTFQIISSATMNGNSICPSNNCDSVTLTITDTGLYHVEIIIIASSYGGNNCRDQNYQIDLHVHYLSVNGIAEINNQNTFQFYPSVSSGSFRIKTKEHLKKIVVTDGVGRIVYSSFVPVSEINLSGAADGIYFYAIEDEKGRMFRGKVVKE